MRIDTVHIQGYRCLGDLSVNFDGLTAFVGSGGVGKSTILNALDWFFHGGDLDERDLHRPLDSGETAKEVIVAVTFSDLNGADREILGGYVQGQITTLTRSWNQEDGEKLSGNALVLPDFEQVREAKGAIELRKRYRELYEAKGAELELFEPVGKADETERNMEIWERQHPGRCEPRTKEARHLGGFAGTPLLADRFDYVLVGATDGAPEVLGGARGSILDRLLSVVEELDSASRERIEELQQHAQGEIQGIVAKARGKELLSIAAGITKRVETYFPGAAIELTDEVAPPRPPQISVRALVSDRGGHPIEPELQGHGLQRALVIGLLHELADSTLPEGVEREDSEPRALMLAIEEPELYQHPLQARALASALEGLATKSSARTIQVAFSTHSPYFTRPALFADLRLCRRVAPDGGTACVAADPEAISTAIDAVGYSKETAESVYKALAESLREAIFAKAVLLCEGPSDAAVLEGVADVQGGLDADGIAVAACGSKPSLIIAVAVLMQLEIPFLALFDADVTKGNAGEAEKNKQILAVCGEEPTEWPGRAVRERTANFEDCLETDLENLWPDFDKAREEVTAELGAKPGKKNDRIYREAVSRAGEPPEFLLDVLDAARRQLI
jgi:predicted ATP-dependent endonuclease of OLD family